MVAAGLEGSHLASRPIRLPEFSNIEFGWGMCPNPMCPNFCVLYGSEDGPGGDDLRYRQVHEGGKLTKLHYRLCGINTRLHSTKSLREIARRFLSLSLPFANCGNGDCDKTTESTRLNSTAGVMPGAAGRTGRNGTINSPATYAAKPSQSGSRLVFRTRARSFAIPGGCSTASPWDAPLAMRPTAA